MKPAVPVGAGDMAALIGMDLAAVRSVCARAAEAVAGQVVSTANLNSSGQIVIAGNREAVERAAVLAREAGAKRAIMLQVSAPFHCSLMKPAEERLSVDLDELRFSDLRFPLVTNVDALPIRTGPDARDALKRQVSMSVRWQESVQRLIAEGVGKFIEVGPGKVLLGLIRSIDKSVTMQNVEDEKSLENVLNGL